MPTDEASSESLGESHVGSHSTMAASEDGASPAHGPDLGQPGHDRWDGSHLLGGLPGRRRLEVRAAHAPALQQQGDHDDGAHDGVGEQGAGGVPVDARSPARPRATAARATAGRSTILPITRAARMRRRKPKVETLPPIGQPDDAGPQPGPAERQEGGHDPDDGLEALDGNAQQGGPVRPLGRRPHGHTDVGPAQEDGQGDHHERGHDQGSHLVGAEDQRFDGEADVPGQVEGLGLGPLAPQPGQEQGARPEQGGQPDGGHGEDEPGGVEEAADDGQLDDGADHHGRAGGRRRGPTSSSIPEKAIR